MKRPFCLTILIVLIFTSSAIADYRDTIPVISFRVIDSKSGEPVPLAHAVNTTLRKASISDLMGYFTIPFSIGDTIKITSLGYFNYTLFNWGQFRKDSLYYDIKLISRSYDLKEVKISWFATYDRFLKGVSDLQIPISKEEESLKKVTEYFNRTIIKLALVDLPEGTSGITFGKDWYMKQNEKLAEYLEKEKQKRRIEKKYNPSIVSELTGLTGKEVFQFMEYCAFNDAYLLRTSDYDIRSKILENYKKWIEDKDNWLNQ